MLRWTLCFIFTIGNVLGYFPISLGQISQCLMTQVFLDGHHETIYCFLEVENLYIIT